MTNYGNYPDLRGVKKILIIKMRHHGDVLLSSPVFSFLKKQLPNAVIDAMVYQDTHPMLEGHPAISGFHFCHRKKKGLFRDLALYAAIRKAKYDLVLNLTEGDRGAIAALVSGAKIRIGIDPKGKGFLGKRKVFTHLFKSCSTPRHSVEKDLDGVRRMGIFPTPEERELFFHIPEELSQKWNGYKGYVVVHAVSRWRFKCWPHEKVAALLKRLHEQEEKILMTASPDPVEMAMVDEILKMIPEVSVANLAGQTSLKELGALIKGAKGVICVDSVPLHMASALKTPVVAIFGPSSDTNWGPWRHPKGRVVAQNYSCRPCNLDGCGGSKKSDCLQTLPVEMVLNAWNGLSQSEVFTEIGSASLSTL